MFASLGGISHPLPPRPPQLLPLLFILLIPALVTKALVTKALVTNIPV